MELQPVLMRGRTRGLPSETKARPRSKEGSVLFVLLVLAVIGNAPKVLNKILAPFVVGLDLLTLRRTFRNTRQGL